MATTGSDRRWLGAGLLGCGVLLIANAWPSLGTTVDDAWISARYADQLVAGHGLVYSEGLPPIEGFTNLLWTLLLAVGILVEADLFTWMEALGLLSMLALLPLTAAAARQLAGRWHPGVLLAPVVVAASPHVAIAGTNGLETSFWLAALVGVPLALSQAESPSARLCVGVLAGLLGAIRPEGFVVGAVLVLAALWQWRRQALPVACAALITVVALVALRWALYGALVPNTFAAKAGAHAERNLRYLAYDGLMWPLLLGLSVAAVPGCARRRPAALAWALGALLVGIALQVNLWMPGGRLLLPGLVVTACLLGGAAASEGRGRWLGGATAALIVVGWLSGVPRHARGYDRQHSVVPANPASQAARHLRRHLPAGSWVAVRDAGLFAYHLGAEVSVVETHHRALTLPHPGGADADVLGLVPLHPEVIVSTSRTPADGVTYGTDRTLIRRTEQPYMRLGKVRQHYRRHYTIHVRADLEVPPLPSSVPVVQ